MSHVTRIELRRCALAISVLLDIDVSNDPRGTEVRGVPPVVVTWRECRAALGGLSPASDEGRRRLGRWFLRRRWVADHPYDDLAERARPVGLPSGHVLHPGDGWVRDRVVGDSLDLGLGFLGLQPGHPDRVIVVPEGVFAATETSTAAFWPDARRYLERMGALALERWWRDRAAVVRPMGDCDVVTLLGSRVFRTAITADESQRMRAAVVPMRTRGWLDVSRIDPAFGPAAAKATDAVQRGFARPILVTADEVSVVPAGGRPQAALEDPAPQRDWLRPLVYR